MRPGRTNVAAFFLSLTSLAVAVQAQCDPQFLPGPDQQYPGINGFVLASTSWDPDGPGPQASLLIVGGSFSIAGESLASNIAAWDGEHWLPLGTGTSGPVYALTTYQGELIAGGHFTTAGGAAANHIARWNGAQWQALGTGMTSSATSGPNRWFGAIKALSVFEGELVAGGWFSAAGGEPANNVARWDGATWRPLGAGVSSGGVQPLSAMVVHQGELYVGGFLSSAGGAPANKLARWDGARWRALDGSAPNGSVYSLASYQDDLVIGGSNGLITRWNGSTFQQMGTAVMEGADSYEGPIECFTVHEGSLYAAGDFVVYGETWADSALLIARWDGSEWRRVEADQFSVPVRTITSHNGRLVAGMYGDNHNVCELEGQTWHPLDRGLAKLASLAVYQGELIAGGLMNVKSDAPASALARWNGESWQGLNLFQYPGVQSLVTFNNHLVVGVSGLVYGPDAIGAGILQWDGIEWSTPGPTPSQNSNLVNVRAMVVNQGSLVAAGSFTFISDITASNIARWDGISWHPMGSGLAGAVSALASFEGDCIAVSPSNTVNRFNGTAWQTVGPSMNGPVNAVFSYQNELIAAGRFQSAGSDPVSNIARLNAGQWIPVGAGLPHSVNVLTTFHGDLVAVGVTTLNNQWTGHVSRWNGNAWVTSSFPTDGNLLGAIEYNNQLVIAGEFTTINGTVSAYWTRWSFATADFNHDGDVGTDADIEAFFACLAGDCCPACATSDFNGDGDFGTDADIESCFRVLAGGPC